MDAPLRYWCSPLRKKPLSGSNLTVRKPSGWVTRSSMIPFGDRRVTTVRYKYGSLTPFHKCGLGMFRLDWITDTAPGATGPASLVVEATTLSLASRMAASTRRRCGEDSLLVTRDVTWTVAAPG